MAHDAEINAIAFGLLFAVIIGACIVVAALITAAKRKSPYDQVGREIHPADDPWDDWELLNRYKAHKREKGEE